MTHRKGKVIVLVQNLPKGDVALVKCSGAEIGDTLEIEVKGKTVTLEITSILEEGANKQGVDFNVVVLIPEGVK